MRTFVTALALGVMALTSRPLQAQQASTTGAAILGTWQAELREQRKDAPRVVIVRADSSASYGTETVRWRLKPDSIMLALGGEWVTYRLQLKKSGGDIEDYKARDEAEWQRHAVGSQVTGRVKLGVMVGLIEQ